MIEKVISFYIKNSIRAIEEKCNRCLGDNIITDYNGIKYCLDCNQYQEINSEKFLLRQKRNVDKTYPKLKLDFILNEEQKQGSIFMENCYKERKNAFLQAVCGAGKTEIILAVILRALTEYKSICLVIPRVEIIKQVTERMNKYFPDTKILSLYGGSNKIDNSPLIIATPQQLIKFYQEFDLVIIDEVDAFPFINNLFLERLVEKARKSEGIVFQMSATITEKLARLIKNQKIEYHLISRRYHKRDLPIPRFIKSRSLLDSVNLILIKKYTLNNNPLIIYVSSIKKAYLLKDYLNKERILSAVITSESKAKKTVLKDFQRLNPSILISTTILERGVTFPNINVLVLEADQTVFNEATLIQIAGRVGRVTAVGEVVFTSKFISEEMINAKKSIIEFNRGKNDLRPL